MNNYKLEKKSFLLQDGEFICDMAWSLNQEAHKLDKRSYKLNKDDPEDYAAMEDGILSKDMLDFMYGRG